MKFRYIFSMFLTHVSTILFLFGRDADNRVLSAILFFTSSVCVFFGIKWFCDMIGSLIDLEEKVEWQEKRLDKHKDDIVHLCSKTDRIEYKLDEVEDESRRAF